MTVPATSPSPLRVFLTPVPLWVVPIALLLASGVLWVVIAQGRSFRVGSVEIGSYQNPATRNCQSIISNTTGIIASLQDRSHQLGAALQTETQAIDHLMSQRDDYKRHPDPNRLRDVFDLSTPYDESLRVTSDARDKIEQGLMQDNQAAIDAIIGLRKACLSAEAGG